MSDMDEEPCCDGSCDHLSQYSAASIQPSPIEHEGGSSPIDCNTDGEASYGVTGRRGSKTSRDTAGSVCRSGRSAPSYSTRSSPPRSRRYEVPHIPRRTDFGEYYPDGGWGWTVCGAAFIVHFICQGFHLASGTLIVQVQAEFESSKPQTVWLGSVTYGICLFLCPFVIAFCRRKSVRVLAVVGGLICSLGCLFMSFSTQLHQLYVSTSVVLGLGTGICKQEKTTSNCSWVIVPLFASGITLSASGVVLGRYFSKRRECAEMLTMSGGGVGMALISVFLKQMTVSFSWMRSMQMMVGVMFPTIIAGTLYRSTSLYHPRRRAILHIKNMRKSKKQQKEFENRPPYLDFSPLRMRVVQLLMFTTLIFTMGAYTPFVILPLEASKDGLDDKSTLLLMVFMGVAYAFGNLLFGLVVIRSSLRCMVARQYLTQVASFGAGLAAMLFTMASGFNAYSMYVWAYGFFAGGFFYSLKVYSHELVTMKLSERAWGFISISQSIPTVIGPPLALYLNMLAPLGARTGFLFCGSCMIVGSVILFLMPWASKHRSNHEIVQAAHFNTKNYEDDHMFYGMEVSEDMSLKHNNISYMYPYIQPAFKKRGVDIKSVSSSRRQLGLISEEDGWSDLDAMTPMSATDKVTEFLVNSQTMLQNYSQLHHIELPDVRLEINNEYGTGVSASDYVHTSHLETVNIKDLKLEATLFHHLPKKKKTHEKERVLKNNFQRDYSDGGGSPIFPGNHLGEHSPDISPLVERVNPFPSLPLTNHINRDQKNNCTGHRYYGNSMKNLQEVECNDNVFEAGRGPRPAKSVPLLVTCEKTTTV